MLLLHHEVSMVYDAGRAQLTLEMEVVMVEVVMMEATATVIS